MRRMSSIVKPGQAVSMSIGMANLTTGLAASPTRRSRVAIFQASTRRLPSSCLGRCGHAVDCNECRRAGLEIVEADAAHGLQRERASSRYRRMAFCTGSKSSFWA